MGIDLAAKCHVKPLWVPNYERITILPHARSRLKERNVLPSDITSAICGPDKKTFQRFGTSGGKVYLHSKKIGDAKLYVAAEIVDKHAYVVTVFWEDDQKP